MTSAEFDEGTSEVDDQLEATSSELQEEEASQEEVLPSDKVVDLVEYLVCSLVEDVNGVSLDVTDGDNSALIEISCSADDIGRVIGRKGRTIKAIRTLARALGQRIGTSVEVEVLG